MAFENLLRVANGVERAGPGANCAEPRAAQAVDDAADAEEPVEVLSEALRSRQADVLACERELRASLHKVVADGDLAAERIAAARGRELVQIVWIALDEDGHVQTGHLERVRDALFVAEIREADEDAVDLVAMLLEEGGAFPGI